jgi:hypothetical protein
MDSGMIVICLLLFAAVGTYKLGDLAGLPVSGSGGAPPPRPRLLLPPGNQTITSGPVLYGPWDLCNREMEEFFRVYEYTPSNTFRSGRTYFILKERDSVCAVPIKCDFTNERWPYSRPIISSCKPALSVASLDCEWLRTYSCLIPAVRDYLDSIYQERGCSQVVIRLRDRLGEFHGYPLSHNKTTTECTLSENGVIICEPDMAVHAGVASPMVWGMRGAVKLDTGKVVFL